MAREAVEPLFALLLCKVKFVRSRSWLIVLLAILVFGCGTNADTTQSSESIQNQESTPAGTNGQLPNLPDKSFYLPDFLPLGGKFSMMNLLLEY